MGLLIFLFVNLTNKIVGDWGQQRLRAEEQKIQHLQQGFGGIKEILLSGKLEYFVRRYHQPNHISGLMNKKEYIFQYVPKLGVEVIAIFGLVGMCIYLIIQGKSHQEVTHMLGLMATAGFRMIPSFSRILNNLQSIRYGWASVDTLIHEFNSNQLAATSKRSVDASKTESKKLAFKEEIKIHNLSFSYSSNDAEILKEINLSISRGKVVGLVGKSGSGKSTFVNLLLGLLESEKGQIILDGQQITKESVSEWQKMIGYVPQEIYLMDDTIRRNIAFGVEDDAIRNEQVLEVMKIAQLESLLENSHDGLDSLLGERGAKLSGGQRQRIGIARALYHDPEIIILDEATSALDQKTENEILETFKPMIGPKTFLIITHRQTSLEMCSQVYHLKDGILLS